MLLSFWFSSFTFMELKTKPHFGPQFNSHFSSHLCKPRKSANFSSIISLLYLSNSSDLMVNVRKDHLDVYVWHLYVIFYRNPCYSDLSISWKPSVIFWTSWILTANELSPFNLHSGCQVLSCDSFYPIFYSWI